jgi:RNA polymerase sigma-70 factor, ECF subfamily
VIDRLRKRPGRGSKTSMREAGPQSRRAPRERSGDVGELYAQHAARVHRWVLRFHAPEEAEEVVHEIFLKVLERIDGFRHDASPTTWLYRLTTNHCLNRRRNEGRRAELWREHAGAPWVVPAASADQHTVTYLREFWRSLDDEQVTIGLLHFVDGMTHAEIARIVGCSPRTVGNRIDALRVLARAHEEEASPPTPGRPTTREG